MTEVPLPDPNYGCEVLIGPAIDLTTGEPYIPDGREGGMAEQLLGDVPGVASTSGSS